MKKYELVQNDTIKVGGAVLYRIRALRDIPATRMPITPGTLGGYVQSEANLSQEGECWIAEGAKAYGKARVTGNAFVQDSAEVCQRAQVGQDSTIMGQAKVNGCAHVGGTAVIGGDTVLCGIVSVSGTQVVLTGVHADKGVKNEAKTQ